MEWLWLAVPLLACGAMMLVMFVPMFMKRNDSPEPASKEDVAELREEIARLRAARALEDREGVSG